MIQTFINHQKKSIMENRELEEKVMIIEELIQGFAQRMHGVETETQTFFKSTLVHCKETLSEIADSIKKVSEQENDSKIIRQIEELQNIVAITPKVVTVKNSHHFGAWSKSFIICVTLAFIVTSGSIATVLHLNNENSRLESEAFNFWLVRAFYPGVSLIIEKGLKDDREGFIEKAEKLRARQQTIISAQNEAAEIEIAEKAVKEKLKRLKNPQKY